MQTCSNCGATSRDGAKFCTTCGSRFNEVIDSDSPSGWQSYSDAEETAFSPAAADDDADNETGEIESPQPEEPAVSTTSWSWGQSADDVPEPVAEVGNEVEAVAETETTDSESLSSWANQWSEPAVEEPTSVGEPEYEVTSDVEEFLESAEEAVEESEVAEAVEEQPDDESATAAAAITIPELTVDTEESPTPKARAQALIYELRELIDESFDAPEEASSASPGAVEALATLNEVPSENGQFDNLRSILETAREQPRDVDTMLNLLGEINSLIALVDSHEQLVTAVETAKQQLS